MIHHTDHILEHGSLRAGLPYVRDLSPIQRGGSHGILGLVGKVNQDVVEVQGEGHEVINDNRTVRGGAMGCDVTSVNSVQALFV